MANTAVVQGIMGLVWLGLAASACSGASGSKQNPGSAPAGSPGTRSDRGGESRVGAGAGGAGRAGSGGTGNRSAVAGSSAAGRGGAGGSTGKPTPSTSTINTAGRAAGSGGTPVNAHAGSGGTPAFDAGTPDREEDSGMSGGDDRDAGDPGPSEPPPIIVACCDGAGRCMPPELANIASAQPQRDQCDADQVCVPNALADPSATPKACASIDGAEGRCLATCLGELSALPGLPNVGCSTNEVCIPCFDPINGRSTGACNIHGDAPAEPAYRFPSCCSTLTEGVLGRCVPPEVSRARGTGLYARDSCASDRFCEPIAKLENPDYQYPVCLGIGPGRCMPACLVDPLEVLLLTNLLCSLVEVCVPCSASNEICE